MKLPYYVGLAKPKLSHTWLPFAGVVAAEPETAVERMRERFPNHVGNNYFQNIDDWEFAAAMMFLPDEKQDGDVLGTLKGKCQDYLADLEQAAMNVEGYNKSLIEYMIRLVTDHIDKIDFNVRLKERA